MFDGRIRNTEIHLYDCIKKCIKNSQSQILLSGTYDGTYDRYAVGKTGAVSDKSYLFRWRTLLSVTS